MIKIKNKTLLTFNFNLGKENLIIEGKETFEKDYKISFIEETKWKEINEKYKDSFILKYALEYINV